MFFRIIGISILKTVSLSTGNRVKQFSDKYIIYENKRSQMIDYLFLHLKNFNTQNFFI